VRGILPDIDFIIPWVNGQEKRHLAKRLHYQREILDLAECDVEQSVSDNRFFQFDELKYTLRSIKEYAPWYRNIFLITDNQLPSFLVPSQLHLDRITIIDHSELFKRNEHFLPTFNTRSIATNIHKLPQLSEYFVYGNDDFMLSAPVEPSFFFKHDLPVVMGEWRTISEEENVTLYQQGMINSATLEGYGRSKFIMLSHGFQAMRKSLNVEAECIFKDAFTKNLTHRFRHRNQFLVESLMNHFCHKRYNVPLSSVEPMVHFSFELCRSASKEKIHFLFSLLESGARSMFCLNEYQSLVERMPEIRHLLEALCGEKLKSEMETSL